MIFKAFNTILILSLAYAFFSPMFDTPEHQTMRAINNGLTHIENATLDALHIQKTKTWDEKLIDNIKSFTHLFIRNAIEIAKEVKHKLLHDIHQIAMSKDSPTPQK